MLPDAAERRPDEGPALNKDHGEEVETSISDPGDNLDTVTAPAVIEPAMTEPEAARLTQRIELRLSTIADNTEAVIPMIEEAKNGNAHQVLGYRSWTEYVTDKFGGALTRLTKVERLPFVELMADQGMSTRAIGEVVGVSKDTVSRDLRAGVSSEPPDRPTAPAPASAKVRAIREAHATKTTGLDGKVYPRPTLVEPGKPRRRPLPDSYSEAAYKLEKVVTTLSNLHQDDRFTSNRDSVRHYGSALARAANELLDLLDDLGIDRHKYGGA